MATKTDDPRIRAIEKSAVYGLFHNGLLIYIGATRLDLKRRLNLHAVAARVGQKHLPVSEHIREHVADEREELQIRELDFDSEEEALKELGSSTLNIRRGGGGVSEEDLYDWSPAELDVLEEKGPTKASETLDASYTDCCVAARKLEIGETRSQHLSDTAVRKIWTQYHLDEEQTYAEVAKKVTADVSGRQVGGIVREDNYQHVPKPSKTAIEAAEAYDDIVREEAAVGVKKIGAR